MATEDELKKIYADALKQQTDQINQQQQATNQQLDKRKEENHQTVQRNLNRTAAEADKAAMNMAELHNAYGLTSGGRAQARLSQSNQTAANMTSIRTAGMTADEAVEQERTNLARQYANAIKAAQEANNLELAKALYAEARRKENELNAQKQKNAQLMASIGDYSLYGELNGLTPEQVAQLEAAYAEAHAPKPSHSGGSSSGSGGSSSGWKPTYSGGSGGSNIDPNNYDPTLDRTPRPHRTSDDVLWGMKEEEATAQPKVDQNSVKALGYGNISAAELDRLVRSGEVEEYTEGGYIKFRRVAPANRPHRGGGLHKNTVISRN